jgi:hypothetical protein
MQIALILQAEPDDGEPVFLLRLASPTVVRGAVEQALRDAERIALAFGDDDDLSVFVRSELSQLRDVMLAIDTHVTAGAAVN